MSVQSFINQNDPTLPLDLSSISLQKQYTKLTEREKLLVFCKINGFYRLPPTIRQMYEDPYMLGGSEFFDGGSNIYEYWKEKLDMIYPSPVTTSKTAVVLMSAIGTGKSTMSRLMLAYNYTRMLCMTNPSKTLRLTPKPFSAVITHRDVDVADKEFKYWFTKEALLKSPYFKNIKPNFKFQILTSGPLGQAGLGSDVIQYIISEVNFYPNEEKAQNIIATALGRFTSRFDARASSMLGNIVIDSSPKGQNGPTNWFIDQVPPENIWVCRAAHYEVKPDSYRESNGLTFPVYIGDGKYPPQILPEDYRLADDQDPGRVINAPIQLKIEAKMDIVKFLQDKCGVSTGSNDSFFNGSVQCISELMKIDNKIPEVIKVDFYDKSDRLITHISPALVSVPLTTSINIGLDLGITTDYTGLAGVVFNGWKVINGVKWPKIKVLFVVGVTRKEGQETSLFHIFDFLMSMKQDYNICVSADQAFSKQILQDCEREGIKTNGRISTDNVPCEPALYLKNLILLGLIELPNNRRLLREAYDLRYVPTSRGYKIDHPKKATQNPTIFDKNDGRGSKDLWDALASACYSLKMSIDAGEEYGYSNGVDKQLSLMTKLTKNSAEESQKQFQSMMESIF